MSDSQITVRRSIGSDAEAIAHIFSGPHAVWGTLQLPFPHPEKYRERLAKSDDNNVMLVAEVNGEVVGQAGLHLYSNVRRRHTASIGMAVRDDWQGRGVGTALMSALLDLADNWYQLTLVELEVYTDNAPAIHLYEKFGFVLEGTKKRDAFRAGQFVDTHVMARLR